MQNLRQSWRASRWKSQARTLWQRYRDVAELGDQHEVYMRLKEFLESFRAQYQEVAAFGDNSETMDRLYGDCTEILHSLLDYVDRELKLPASDGGGGGGASSTAGDGDAAAPSDDEATRAAAAKAAKHRVMELVPEALRAAELILRDETYVEAIKDSPATIGRILSLLERLQTSELRGHVALAMQLIKRLSSSPEARREIGRLQGFSRLLRLALIKDDALSREVLRTAQSLLREAKRSQQSALGGPAAATGGGGAAGGGGGGPALHRPAARRVSGAVSSIITDLSAFVLPDSVMARLQQWVPVIATGADGEADADADADQAAAGGGGVGGGGAAPPPLEAIAAATSTPLGFHSRPVRWYSLMYACSLTKTSLSVCAYFIWLSSLPLNSLRIFM